jgi:hypothetical protein
MVVLFSYRESRSRKDFVKLTTTLIVALSAAMFAPAQTTTSSTPSPAKAANPDVRHVIGLETVKRNAIGKLTVHDSVLEFKAGKAGNKVPVPAIDAIFVGTETTQSGGTAGRVIKMAAPYESGKALTILMRTKVDILTVSFHDPDGAVHGAIFALPIGQAEPMRAQLVQAGAHSGAPEKLIQRQEKP